MADPAALPSPPLLSSLPSPPASPGPRSGSQCVSSAGSHWLQFFHTVVYGPDIWEPRYIYVSYVDTTHFLGFDSTAGNGVQPRAPWMEQEPPEYWHNQTEEALYQAQGDRKLFRTMMRYYGHSKDGGESSQIRGHNPSHVQLVPLQISRSRVKSRIVIREQG